MAIKLINIGFGNIVSANRIISIVSPESAPIKRIIQEARDRHMLIDAHMADAHALLLLRTAIMLFYQRYSRKRLRTDYRLRMTITTNSDGEYYE